MSGHLHHSRNTDASPISLPLAVITVSDMGVVTITLDGDDFLPPPFAPPWSRANFGGLLDALTEHRTRTVRVEVRESDGSVFTDIIEARRRSAPQTETAPQALPESRRARRSKEPRLAEITTTVSCRARTSPLRSSSPGRRATGKEMLGQ